MTWQLAGDEPFVPFDRRRNVGLHHLALRVMSVEDLHRLHERVLAFPGVVAEFAPSLRAADRAFIAWSASRAAAASNSYAIRA